MKYSLTFNSKEEMEIALDVINIKAQNEELKTKNAELIESNADMKEIHDAAVSEWRDMNKKLSSKMWNAERDANEFYNLQTKVTNLNKHIEELTKENDAVLKEMRKRTMALFIVSALAIAEIFIRIMSISQ